jgi:cytidylate kinase
VKQPNASTITIDGPVAAGKTVVGKLVAKKMSYRFLDTGSMYRALTWLAIKEGLDIKDREALSNLALNAKLEVDYREGMETVKINNKNATSDLRGTAVERAVSSVSQIREVRKAMGDEQQRLASGGRIVMVGRDIGTAILPDAGLKIFLVASVKERAKRRYKELVAGGQDIDEQTVLHDLEKRDLMDSSRAISPLKTASDAHEIDTCDLSMNQVADKIICLAIK